MRGCWWVRSASGSRRRATRTLPATLFLAFLCPASADAQEPPLASKRGYNLFHRTPVELRRPISTDRPDRTESPYTVDAGLFQAEIDLFTYRGDASADGVPGVESSSLSVLPFNLKAGLLPNVDLQFVLETWSWNEESAGAGTERRRGVGAITIRTKVNLWGNDGGRTAFAVMPLVAFVSQPGSAERLVTWGVILPFKLELGAGWGFSSMLELDLVGQGTNTPRRVVAIGSASVGRDIAGPLAFYLEGYGGTVLSDGSAAWEATGDLGLTLGLGLNLQLDAGVNFGFTLLAEDVNPFLGLTVRF